jgi:tetratricopeptide (TPR) repeat protein
MDSHFRESILLLILTIGFCVATFAQQTPMNQFELASQARTKARSLSEAGNYEAALAVLNSLETGKFEAGDAAMQAAAAKVQGVFTDKGRILIRLGRYDQADAAFYQAFDANIAKAEKDLAESREHRGEASTSPKHAEMFRIAIGSAKGAIELAEAVVDLRESHYLLAGASSSAKPFDPARIAKHAELEKTITKAAKVKL